jgi:transposase-like protein
MEPRASSGAEEVKSGSRYIKNARRREYEEWFKAQVVEECHKPGASVSIVARRHDINANVLFRWRREYRLGILKPAPRPARNEGFVSVGVIGDDGKLAPPQPAIALSGAAASAKANPPVIKALPAPAPAPRPALAGVVELHLSGRIKIRIQGDVNKDALRGVLAVVRELA